MSRDEIQAAYEAGFSDARVVLDSAVETCRTTHYQQCHVCPREGCRDNTRLQGIKIGWQRYASRKQGDDK